MRENWKDKFPQNNFPFYFRVVTGESDDFVPDTSSHSPFPNKNCKTIPGGHLEIVKPVSSDHLALEIVVKGLKNKKSNPESIVSPPQVKNPFCFGGIVPVDMFYGRKQILQKILTCIDGKTLQSVSIVGERRMGKSSLLSYVKDELIKQFTQSYQYFIIYLDLMQACCHSRKGLMTTLRRELNKAGCRAWSESQDGDLSVFDSLLEDLKHENIRLILCLDEAENLTKRPAEFDDLLEDWRACGSMGQMAMITATAEPLADLCRQNKLISPFFNIFTQSYLGLLQEKEWQTLVRNNMPVSQDELAFIEENTGGHPMFTQMAVSHLWEMKTGGNMDYAKLKLLLIQDMEPHLQYLWDNLADDEKAALRYSIGKSVEKPMPSVSNLLSLRGILKYDKPFCAPFADFISRK